MENILQLTKDEKNVLESVYGRQKIGGVDYNPNKLESIEPLNAQESKFFTGKKFISPHFFIQTLYKVSGTVNPMKFNATVQKIIKENENMCANFCNVGTRTIKVIKSAENVHPEIIFRNLMQTDEDELDDEFRKILEADMRRDCDIRHDPLIRFAVYKTKSEEFAVLVTIAQIIAKNFNSEKFFCYLADIPYENKEKNILEDLPEKNQETIRDYWSKVLNKIPPLELLPYEKSDNHGIYRQKSFHAKISADILSDLRWRAQSNRVMLTAILQSAWGFMLQFNNKRSDCLFCQILSTNSEENLPIIPVRVTSDGNLPIEQIIRGQFRQLVVSQPYSCVDWTNLENLSTARKKLFNHFLSFKEFKSNELNFVETPAEIGGKIISRNSWDAQGMKLGVYFRYSEKNLSITFLYDEKQFQISGVEKLCALYMFVLQQMLADWNAKYFEFHERLSTRFEAKFGDEIISREDDRKKIRDFLSQQPILQGKYEGTINLFEKHAKIITRYEGDRISGEVLKNNFLFVMSGKLVRNVDSGDGWYNPTDVVSKNAFINPTNLLEKQKLILSAEILSEQAEILMIPHDILIEIMRKNSEVAISIMNYALARMERWQILWLQS